MISPESQLFRLCKVTEILTFPECISVDPHNNKIIIMSVMQNIVCDKIRELHRFKNKYEIQDTLLDESSMMTNRNRIKARSLMQNV